MSHLEAGTPAGEFGAGYWDDRYRSGEGGGRHSPSPALVTETADLEPGRALDAGCGRGADALWLAARGWHVTAVDVSATALDRARAAARSAVPALAERVEWVHADLSTWTPDEGRYDLVTSQYVHVPGPVEELFSRLASWVAPGGTLLVVGHGHEEGQHHEHGPAAGSQVGTRQVTDGLPEDEWDVLVAGSRTHTVRRGDTGTSTRHDAVVRARRRSASHVRSAGT